MPRPRKTLEQLKLTGTYRANKGRYAARLDAESTTDDLHTVQAVRFRSPKQFTPEQRAAHKEIMTTCPGLCEADRLLVEVAAVILARQRAGVAKASELNKLASLLEKFRSRVATTSAVAPASSLAPSSEEDDEDLFIREEDEYQRREGLIRTEMERRKNAAPPTNLTDKEAERWSWYSTVATDLFPDRKVG